MTAPEIPEEMPQLPAPEGVDVQSMTPEQEAKLVDRRATAAVLVGTVLSGAVTSLLMSRFPGFSPNTVGQIMSGATGWVSHRFGARGIATHGEMDPTSEPSGELQSALEDALDVRDKGSDIIDPDRLRGRRLLARIGTNALTTAGTVGVSDVAGGNLIAAGLGFGASAAVEQVQKRGARELLGLGSKRRTGERGTRGRSTVLAPKLPSDIDTDQPRPRGGFEE